MKSFLAVFIGLLFTILVTILVDIVLHVVGVTRPRAVFKKFGEDKAGYLAALVAYYGFFSLFPLMLVMVTVLGYVL